MWSNNSLIFINCREKVNESTVFNSYECLNSQRGIQLYILVALFASPFYAPYKIIPSQQTQFHKTTVLQV